MVKLITGTIKELHRMKVEVLLSIVNRDYRVLFYLFILHFWLVVCLVNFYQGESEPLLRKSWKITAPHPVS